MCRPTHSAYPVGGHGSGTSGPRVRQLSHHVSVAAGGRRFPHSLSPSSLFRWQRKGYAGLSSTTALIVATFCAGLIVLGIQSGINVVGAMIYPTLLRANGSGWQLGIGRLGAIAGPMIGALLVGLPVEQLYIWSALPFAAGAVVTFLIYVLNQRRLRAHPELQKAQ